MKNLLILSLATMISSTLVSLQGQAYDPEGQIDPKTYSCTHHIEIVELEDGRSEVRTVWAHGYYSARRGVDENSAPVTAQMVVDCAQQLERICRENPSKLFITAIKEVQ
ncbi:MAG: hypothetical protein O7D93_00655 [Acidobacteria bacterium]|nr:hypothetical protein [Acidobacteriota bacterium]MCZ6879314.1 hypothetical protein [Acidobacteriota bacterium]